MSGAGGRFSDGWRDSRRRLSDRVGQPSEDLAALSERAWGSFVGRCLRRFLRMEGIDRCIVLSSQAFTALIPLLIVISALVPATNSDLMATSIIKRFGLSGDAADAVHQLFDAPHAAEATISVLSALLLVFSGVSFTRRLQRMYRSAWELEKAGVRSGVFAALGLVALIAEVGVLYGIREMVRNLPLDKLLMVPLSLGAGVLLWTSIPYLLLDRRIHWRRLLVTSGLTALGTSMYGVATVVYMPDLVDQYTQEFGLFGITIAVIGWLLIVAGVIVTCAAVGAEFDASTNTWVVRLKKTFRLHDPDAEPAPPTAAVPTGLTAEDLGMLVRVAVNWLILAAAIWVAALLVPGIVVTGGFLTYVWISLLLGLVNAVLGPFLRLVAFPLTFFTLGVFALVVNAVLLATTAGLAENLAVGNFGETILGALVISLVTTLLELVLRPWRQDA